MSRVNPDEESVENRVKETAVCPSKVLRDEQGDFEVSQDDEHEPSEGYRGVHVTEQRLAFPDFCMEKAVAKQVFDIF